MRTASLTITLILSMLIALPAFANSVASSTMEFEGTLTDEGGGVYTGIIPATEGSWYVTGGGGEGISTDGGFDVYAKEGGCALVQGYYGTGLWNCSGDDTYVIGYGGADAHDGYPDDGTGSPPWGDFWDPDVPDYYHYELKLTADSWALQYIEEYHGTPMSGIMNWTKMYAVETDVGSYTGTVPADPDANDGDCAAHGAGPGWWDMDWTWGSDAIPLQYTGFDVTIEEVGRGVYHVTLTPAAPDEVWVDDDYTSATPGWGATHFDSVQDGVETVAAGGTVYVAAGTYTEQVHITADMSVIGADVDSTFIASPVTLTDYFVTAGPNDNYPVVFIDGATVALSDMTVDGDNQGDANYRFVGVAYWNAGGSMTDMEVLNVMNSTFSGAQHGVGVYSYNDTGGPYTLAMTDVVVDDYQKTAVALFGDNMTVDLDRVTTVGQGATDVTAQNGIQVGYGAGGTLDDCVITGNVYTGGYWTASGMLPSDGTSVTVDGMTLDDNQTSIYLIDMDGSFNDVTVTNPSGDALYAYSTAAKRSPMPRAVASPFDGELGGRGSRYDMTASFTNSTFTGADVVDSYGPTAWVGGTCDFTVNGCYISHWDYGIVAYEDGGTVTSHINDNFIFLNGTYGVYTNATPTRATQDATDNWWGHATGPYHDPLNPSGLGDPVSDGVDFDPYMTANIVCTPDPEYLTATDPVKVIDVDYLGGGGGLMYGYSVTFSWDGAIVSTDHLKVSQGPLLSDQGGTFFFPRSTGANEVTVDCAILGAIDGVTGPGTMFSIEFTGLAVGTSDITITVDRVRDRDNTTLVGFAADDGLLIVDVDNPVVTDVEITNDTLVHTNEYIKDGDDATVTANVSDDGGLTEDDIVADLRDLGGLEDEHPDDYSGGVATWTLTGVTCDPQDGTVTVTVTATDGIGNTASAQGTITSDNTPPEPVADFDASPGNEECSLTWTNGYDLHFDGVVVRRTAVADEYPQYPYLVGAWPAVTGAYPGDETAGTGVYDDTGTSVTDGVVDRNIYYYQAFCYDIVRLYGPADPGARDLATNYWLGDVADEWGAWGYDGEVDDDDILKLSDCYGDPDPTDYPGNSECDVGPTVHPDWHRLGLPLPDDAVEFEDLMVFAMNYGVVMPRVVPFLPQEYDPAALAMTLGGGEVRGDDIAIALRLEGNVSEVKGLSTVISYDTSELEFVSARLTEDMLSPLGDVFFWHGAESGRVTVDLAVLGTGVSIGGSGEVAVLTFRPLSDGYTLEVESARLRDVDNAELDARLGDYASGGDVPLVYRLVGNTPNPFNPVTKVAYHIPEESAVTIRVYDVSGRLVRTLVDDVVEPGRHAAVWDGLNEGGEPASSGVYFCTMEAPNFRESTKMTLLK